MIELYINDKAIDYYQDSDFPLVLNHSLVNSANIESKKGVSTYTIKLPTTNNNLSVLGLVNNINVYNRTSTNSFSCRLIYNNNELIVGRFVITKASKNEIEGFIQDNNSNWVTAISGKTLRDIDFGDGIDYNCGTDTISMLSDLSDAINQYTTNGTFNYNDTNDIALTMIAYQPYYIFNVGYAVNNNWINITKYPNGTFNLPTNVITNKETTYLVNDKTQASLNYATFTPCVFLINTLKKMFENVGYSVMGNWISKPSNQLLLLTPQGDEDLPFNFGKINKYKASTSQTHIAQWRVTFLSLFGIGIKCKVEHIFGVYGLGKTTATTRVVGTPREFGFFADTAYDTNTDNTVGGNPTREVYSMAANLIHFETTNENIGMSDLEDDRLDNLGIERATYYVIPKSGYYQFTVTADIDVNDSLLMRTEYDKRYIGISKFPIDVNDINKIDGGNAINSFASAENVIEIFDVSGYGTGIQTFISKKIYIESGCKIVLWSGCVWDSNFNVYMQISGGITQSDEYQDFYRSADWNSFPLGSFVPNITTKHNTLALASVDFEVNWFDDETKPTIQQITDKLKPNTLLPNISQVDFIKSLMNIFNLYITTDRDMVYIDTYNDLFLDNNSAIDLSYNNSLSEVEVDYTDIPQYYLFKWNTDDKDYSTIVANNQKDIAHIGTDNYNLNIDYLYETFSDDTDVQIIDSNQFCSTSYRRYDIVKSTTSNVTTPDYVAVKSIMIPNIMSEANYKSNQNEIKGTTYDFKPRILSLFTPLELDADSKLLFRYYDNNTASVICDNLIDKVPLTVFDSNSQTLYPNNNPIYTFNNLAFADSSYTRYNNNGYYIDSGIIGRVSQSDMINGNLTITVSGGDYHYNSLPKTYIGGTFTTGWFTSAEIQDGNIRRVVSIVTDGTAVSAIYGTKGKTFVKPILAANEFELLSIYVEVLPSYSNGIIGKATIFRNSLTQRINGLYQDYYSDMIEDIGSYNTFNVDAYITPQQYKAITNYTPIIIDNTLFKVLAVKNYSLIDNRCTLNLLKV